MTIKENQASRRKPTQKDKTEVGKRFNRSFFGRVKTYAFCGPSKSRTSHEIEYTPRLGDVGTGRKGRRTVA